MKVHSDSIQFSDFSAKLPLDPKTKTIEIDLKPSKVFTQPFFIQQDELNLLDANIKKNVDNILKEIMDFSENHNPPFKTMRQIFQKFSLHFFLLCLFVGCFIVVIFLEKKYSNYKKLQDFWVIIQLIIWVIILNIVYFIVAKYRKIMEKRRNRFFSIIDKYNEQHKKDAKSYEIHLKEKTILQKKTIICLQKSTQKMFYLEFSPVLKDLESESRNSEQNKRGIVFSEDDGICAEIDKMIKEIDKIGNKK